LHVHIAARVDDLSWLTSSFRQRTVRQRRRSQCGAVAFFVHGRPTRTALISEESSMIAFNRGSRKDCLWQVDFVPLLPQIERLLNRAFSRLDRDKREEAIQCATVFCLLSYMRLHSRGRTHLVTASTLAWYAVKQTKSGRPAVGRMNSKDVLSSYAQWRRGIKVESSHAGTVQQGWIDELVEDKRAPVLEQVAVKLDAAAWIRTLPRRLTRIAADLALGCTTSETAVKHGLSAGRISQIRRQLESSWNEFQGEATAVNG
jgi:hypothetical protein